MYRTLAVALALTLTPTPTLTLTSTLTPTPTLTLTLTLTITLTLRAQEAVRASGKLCFEVVQASAVRFAAHPFALNDESPYDLATSAGAQVKHYRIE